MKRKSTVLRIIDHLKTLYPDALCSLQYEKDYELLLPCACPPNAPTNG